MEDGGENVLELIYEEENLDDVDMLDAEIIEEGEIKDEKQSTQFTKGDVMAVQTANQGSRTKNRKRKKRKSKKNKTESDPITDISWFVLDACRRLKERKQYLVWNAVGCLGVSALRDLINEVEAIQACGGQMTADGRRPRFGGGILWNILKTREPNAYKEIMTKGKEFENQFRRQYTRPKAQKSQDAGSSERIACAPSDQFVDQVADGIQSTSKGQGESKQSDARGERMPALNRIRVPVAYDDLFEENGAD